VEEEVKENHNLNSGKKNPTDLGEEPKESLFECNICLEIPNEPVVTKCGHLYCWTCIYQVSLLLFHTYLVAKLEARTPFMPCLQSWGHSRQLDPDLYKRRE
jgi:hypothetical protein